MKKINVASAIMYCVLSLGSLPSYAQVMGTVAGTGTVGYSGDGGMATSANFNKPHGIFVDASNSVYICDINNHRIRRELYTGIVTTIVGNGIAGFSPNGTAATSASINNPFDVVVDASISNLYFTDNGNNVVRKVNLTTGIITTIAGTGAASSTGDGGAATSATLNKPTGLCFNNAQTELYVCEQSSHRVRKINLSTGIISHVAGTNGVASFGGDGGAASTAYLNYPNFLSFDNSGNLYITDNGNHRIRKVNSSGIISTLAGNGVGTYAGDGGAATSASLWYPGGTIADGAGSVYIADNLNHRIRKVSSSGIITTVVGTGVGAYSGDGGSPTLAQIKGPVDVCITPKTWLLISDFGNSRVRINSASGWFKTSNTSNISHVENNPSISISPNPSTGNFSLVFKGGTVSEGIMLIYDALGKLVYQSEVVNDYLHTFNLDLAQGVYYVKIKCGDVDLSSTIEVTRP